MRCVSSYWEDDSPQDVRCVALFGWRDVTMPQYTWAGDTRIVSQPCIAIRIVMQQAICWCMCRVTSVDIHCDMYIYDTIPFYNIIVDN